MTTWYFAIAAAISSLRAVTGSEVLPLVGVALLLMLAGAVILRRRS